MPNENSSNNIIKLVIIILKIKNNNNTFLKNYFGTLKFVSIGWD